jgi:isoquinoline 1-oxidoreductase beta subunit
MQTNFNDYPILALPEMPKVESYIVPSTAAPGGVGEPGTGPIAPSLANAIYAATGTRVRSLPLSRHALSYKAQRT